jgi:glycosyltransferase involved in cell wall biosynthesis
MTNGKLLCLNMIVKNEMANLERCLGSVADHIDCWVIGDTGSTDGTQEFIKSFFAARNLPGELHGFPFHNFEQARNAALDCAYASPLDYDYLLFDDADMELVVEDRTFRERLEGPGYRLLQRADSGLAYWNTRLVQRSAGARYYGVTHEYLDVPGDLKNLKNLPEVWYKDHASGSNRVDKFQRDIKLLTKALKTEPDNVRYWFYLAQSYRDAGQTRKAAEAYSKRAEMGGWDEEAWTARLEEARCLRKLGDEGGFVRASLAAFQKRPQRAEPIYDLAKFYREKGMNDASLLFSEAGLAIKRPGEDILFLEDFVYTAGLQEEFSIAANYARDPVRKDRGFSACNWLALNREIPARSRLLAWSNLYFYVHPLGTSLPSFTTRPVEFTVPNGYRPSNPSVARLGEQILLVLRTVNFTMTDDGQYEGPDGGPVHTRNFLLRLDDGLDTQSSAEILSPIDMPDPSFDLVLGFEDLRLFSWRGELWCNACIRELTPEGWCEQVLARIDNHGSEVCRLTDWRVLQPEGDRLHQKNWMPQVSGERLQFIYSCDPTRVVEESARTIIETSPAVAAPRFRGGSQLIPFDGGYLALIHEVNWRESDKRRYYWHRFVWFDETNRLRSVSRPFFFQKKGIEFAAGLAWHPDGHRLLISYGVADEEAWIATVDAGEVRAVLEDVERLRSGTLGAGGGLSPSLAPRNSGIAVEANLEPDEDQSKAVDRLKEVSPICHVIARRSDQKGPNHETMPVSGNLSEKADSQFGHTCNGSPSRVFTNHRTMVYIDRTSGELRHGPVGDSPVNVSFVAEGAHGQIIHHTDGLLNPVVCLSDRSLAVESPRERPHSVTATKFEVVELDRGRVGLKADGLYLCAEPDGRLTLSRKACSTWESFRISDNLDSSEPPSTDEIFLKLAPFLRAADSPQERRRLSRDFDARIASLLSQADGASLPQIHCFYEVLSDNAEHRTLIAATASMRAAGHSVRVWSYSPQKLDFLRPHGVEVRAADDVMPRGLFQRIVAGSEIRYFSDIFRYAVLYEHGGLWMDSDVILLRPFPFRGDHFFNLQWRSGSKKEHFICGNVMYAKPYSRHLRALYEMSIERFDVQRGRVFGDIGPKLLSDYIASEAGAELRERVFSPMFFNPIDWTEIDRFDQPISELTDYLNDDRVFGVHLWTARNAARADGEGTPLISLLSDPFNNLPTFTNLADHFNTDKNRHSGNRHCYARVYDRLLSDRRLSIRRLMEIGLCRGLAERNQADTPSVKLWQTYFPFCHVIGVDLTDFSALNNERFTSFVCDQSKLEELHAVATKLEPGSLDVLIDDGSHASFDEQLTLCEFFPLLADGGWYFIEDLDWQPPGEDPSKITLTKNLLREIQEHGSARSFDPLGVSKLAGQMAEILFFDSHYELTRAKLLGGLVAIRKRGGTGLVR